MESFMARMMMEGQQQAYPRLQQESRASRERRIALFTERVEDLEVQYEHMRAGAVNLLTQDHQPRSRKPSTRKVDLGSLSPISVAELSVGKVHKGRVLYCRTATRCMCLQSLATLVEDSDGQLSSLAVYNAPRVSNIWEAQAWLPEGTSLAIVEPFFKLRQDGTPGIRVDDPKELVRDAAPPGSAPGSSVAVEERLRQLSKDAGLGYKRIHKQLLEEGHEISQNKVREQVARLRKGVPADGATAGPDASVADTADRSDRPPDAGSSSRSGAPSPAAGSKVEGVLPLQAHVRVEGLQSEAGKALNGCEGSVASHDFAAGRLGVDIAGVGRRSVRTQNLRVLSVPSTPLPMPSGQWLSVDELCSEGRWHEALVLAECFDQAFLSHSMRAFHPRIWQIVQERGERGGEGDAVFRLVMSIVKAHCDAQAMGLGEMWDLNNPSSILPLADKVVEGSKGRQRVEHVAALFFRGTLQKKMSDYHAAARDCRAAYAASEGSQPWILKQAGWAAASSTDGVSRGVMLQNYMDGQVMYEMLLHHVDRLADEGNLLVVRSPARVFCLWELAQVLLWRRGWIDPMSAPMMARLHYGIQLGPADTDGPAAEALMERVHALKERALKAESMLERGIMNSLARDTVMGISTAIRQRAAKQTLVTPRPDPSQAGETGGRPSQQAVPEGGEAAGSFPLAEGQELPTSVSSDHSGLSAFMKMQAKEVSRMEEEEQALRDGDMMSYALRCRHDAALNASITERGFQERRKVLEAKAETLAAREAAFKRREAEQAEQRACWQQEAERLQGNSAALEELCRQEQQRQAKDFAAETARLRAQHVAEVAEIRQQLDKAARQSEREMRAAMDAQRQLELALREAVGAKDSEAERWQRELCAKEEQVAFEQDSLAAQGVQLAEMQAELAEKRRLLEERDRQLQQEKQAKEQLLAGGSLSKELLGAQRSGHHCVSIHEVKFSQDSIAATFRDGRSIEQTTRDLRQGKLKPADLPTLRVVELPVLRQIWSLDNRRLRCLKDAFPQGKMKIDVKVVPLSDPAVQAEFRKKWTAGESIHVRGATGRRQHAA